MTQLVIVGIGGMGREAAAWVDDVARRADFIGFLDDASAVGAEVAGHPVLGSLDWLSTNRDAEVVAAVRSPAARAELVENLDALGVALATIVHPTARIGPHVTLGDGAIIGPGVVLTRDITVGRAVIINAGAMVGHDSSVGDLVLLGSGVRVAGDVTIEAHVDVGIGATIAGGVTVGAGAVVEPGATTVDDVAPRHAPEDGDSPRLRLIVGEPAPDPMEQARGTQHPR